MVIAKRELKSPEELHDLQAQGLLRASMYVASGCYAGIGFAPAARSEKLMSTSLSCDPTDPNCVSGELVPILNKISDMPPLEAIAFGLVTVLNGKRGSWAETVRERVPQQEESLYVAAAHIMGCGPHNGLIEVMASQAERALSTLLDLTDVDGVVDVRVLRGRSEHTRGFGTRAASA